MNPQPTTPTAHVPLDEGHVIADFRLLEHLPRESPAGRVAAADDEARGWTTWRAVDLLLGRPVALKLLHRDDADLDACRAVAAELRQGVWLAHPGLVRRYGLREDGEWVVVAEALIDGARTLGDVVAPLDPAARERRLVTAFVKVAEALAVAHGVGLEHGVLSPGNLLVTVDGLPKVSDVGLHRLLAEPRRRARLAVSPHASPEQCLALRRGVWHASPASDQFALAALLHEALTGRHPFTDEDETPRADRALVRRRRRLPRGGPLDVVLGRALEADPRDRHRDMATFADDLVAVLEGRRPSSRAPGLAGRLRRAALRWTRRIVA